MYLRKYQKLKVTLVITLQFFILGNVNADSKLATLAEINDPVNFKVELAKEELSDIDYYSLLMRVCKNVSNEDVYTILVDEIDKNTKFKDYDYQIITIELLHKDLEACAVKLVNNILDLNKITPMGGTLLHEAMDTKSYSLAKVLLDKDVNVDIYDGRNKKAINYSVSSNNLEMFKLLLSRTNLTESIPHASVCFYSSLRSLINYTNLKERSVYLKLLDHEYKNRVGELEE